jgi:hypothetical protein
MLAKGLLNSLQKIKKPRPLSGRGFLNSKGLNGLAAQAKAFDPFKHNGFAANQDRFCNMIINHALHSAENFILFTFCIDNPFWIFAGAVINRPH